MKLILLSDHIKEITYTDISYNIFNWPSLMGGRGVMGEKILGTMILPPSATLVLIIIISYIGQNIAVGQIVSTAPRGTSKAQCFVEDNGIMGTSVVQLYTQKLRGKKVG